MVFQLILVVISRVLLIYIHCTFFRYLSKSQLVSAIQGLRNKYPEGYSNPADGFDKARTEIFGTSADRSTAPNIVFIITDGIATKNMEQTFEAVVRLKRDGAIVYAIGITGEVDETSLKTYSSPPQLKDQNYFTCLDFNELDTLIDRVVAQTGNCPTTFSPATTPTTTVTTTRTTTKVSGEHRAHLCFLHMSISHQSGSCALLVYRAYCGLHCRYNATSLRKQRWLVIFSFVGFCSFSCTVPRRASLLVYAFSSIWY